MFELNATPIPTSIRKPQKLRIENHTAKFENETSKKTNIKAIIMDIVGAFAQLREKRTN